MVNETFSSLLQTFNISHIFPKKLKLNWTIEDWLSNFIKIRKKNLNGSRILIPALLI